MKLPRGFGKNYFSLSAITATVNLVALQQEYSRVQSFHISRTLYEQEEEPEEIEELEICQTQQLSLKSCHCNILFRLHTQKTLQLFTYPKKYPSYHLFINNDVSPPASF